ncbi:hypothetical protein SODALDRAFT_357034 [Sodiomyces alkalinus F11]|uniref:Uncharacterized protein n=1 Tax=Sodiomyces alkalinus (strain CBS 110278 / VKM F-3762 / F11) TaxID=1314773 RepID=A0A3N2Q2P9_SODAK|nr:hypothetical protein SODALDRAFT_357034 [Sodiomyces alkalinus F11]ROT41007.1 hypothetical protein SODALDRAFT_357034 [Sodiomyces alkalinus F11]
MPVYCSNFYGSIQCRGYAPRFGERCGFCTVHRRGRPLKPGLLPPAEEPDWNPPHTPSDDDEDEEFDEREYDASKRTALRRRRGAETGVRQQLQSLLDCRRSSS